MLKRETARTSVGPRDLKPGDVVVSQDPITWTYTVERPARVVIGCIIAEEDRLTLDRHGRDNQHVRVRATSEEEWIDIYVPIAELREALDILEGQK